MVFFAPWRILLASPPARGFTAPMAATFAWAASLACTIGIRSAAWRWVGEKPPELEAAPLLCAPRTRSRTAATMAFSSAIFSASLATPRCLSLAGFRAGFGVCRDHAGFQSAAWREVTPHRRAHRLAGFHDVAQDAVHRVLLKNAEIAISQHVH